MDNKLIKWFIIGTFVTLYLFVSLISTIHVIDFFELSNPRWLAITLAIAFEVGAAASLASLVVLDKMNKTIVWSLFITLTLMQAAGNMFYAYTHLTDFKPWVELFGLIKEDEIFQKRILSIVSGAILPLIALGFIKSLVDYIKPTKDVLPTEPIADKVDEVTEVSKSTPDIDILGVSSESPTSDDTYLPETPITSTIENNISKDEILGKIKLLK